MALDVLALNPKPARTATPIAEIVPAPKPLASKLRMLEAVQERSQSPIKKRSRLNNRVVRFPSHEPVATPRRSAPSKKLEQFRPQTCTLESLQRSHPHIYKDHLSHRLYIDGKAYPAQQVGSLAVVWREELQGFQVYSWALRLPVSSVCFEIVGCCHDAAVELDQWFDMDSILRLQPFGAMEAVDEIVQRHCLREEVVLEQQVS